MRTCEYCSFFSPWRNESGPVLSKRQGYMGECRHRSPVAFQSPKNTANGEPKVFTKWPPVSEHDFCGSFRPKEAPLPLTLPLASSNAPALRTDACG